MIKDEQQIELHLRKNKFLIPAVSILVGCSLFAGISICLIEFKNNFWTIIPAAFFAHAFFIIMVHDAAHNSITQTKFDSFLMNFSAGIILLPFYAEPFRKYHYTHHMNANTEHDPLWSEVKSNMYTNKWGLYMLCQLIPILFTAYVILHPNKTVTTKIKRGKTIEIRWSYMAFSIFISLVVIFLVKPSIFFILGALFILNMLATVRHWCEHMGTEENKESNTFWFPLGMGIGNHDVHHDHPNFSWLSLSIGLIYRKKDTNPFKTLLGIFFNSSFKHFRFVKK